MNELRSTSTGYDEDFYAWTQHQAKLLRRLERLGPELPADIDLSHVAEEIEHLGKAELRGAKSLVREIFVHLIKAASDPQADAVGHWREETALFHDDLPEYFAPSMRQLIDIQQLWRRALNRAELALRRDGGAVIREVPSDCPYTLQEILAENFDFDQALTKLRGPQRRA